MKQSPNKQDPKEERLQEKCRDVEANECVLFHTSVPEIRSGKGAGRPVADLQEIFIDLD